MDPKAIREELDKRQIDEVQVFNLAATRPDLLTGVNPATGKPQPYGSVGVDINCAVIGYTAQASTANLAAPVPTPSSRRDKHSIHRRRTRGFRSLAERSAGRSRAA